MADRFKFAEVRQEVIEMLKKDLLGPSSENEILNQNPRFEYIVGMLAPQTSENDSNEQEIDGDASFEGDADYTAGEDDDNEPVFTNRFKTPSSIGISFYLESSTKSFNVDVTWGDYTKASDKTTNKEGKVTAQFPPNGFEIGDSFYIREVPVEQDPFRRYVGVCAPGQSVKTALLRVYSIILQSAYNLSLDDEYKDVIDPYYTLVGYYNSIRELGGAVRLLQDDIPDRIQRIKKKYGMSRQRFLNHKVEITSRMSSYDIPKKLSQLETPYTDRNCLDTAIATNMIAVGMDVDRLGLMVVTGQPKQNSEYIQATSRIGRSYPGLVVTLYNPYRPRDLSHYENFTGYHAQLYRFVEGTTATPFSARARDE